MLPERRHRGLDVHVAKEGRTASAGLLQPRERQIPVAERRRQQREIVDAGVAALVPGAQLVEDPPALVRAVPRGRRRCPCSSRIVETRARQSFGRASRRSACRRQVVGRQPGQREIDVGLPKDGLVCSTCSYCASASSKRLAKWRMRPTPGLDDERQRIEIQRQPASPPARHRNASGPPGTSRATGATARDRG